jgi:hypothetical protein
VRFAHARLEHQKSEARSADARRLAKALTRRRPGKAATTRFAASKQRPDAHRASSNARSAHLRVSRDGGNGGGRNGGHQSHDSGGNDKPDKGGKAASVRLGPAGVPRAGHASGAGASAAPVFASHLGTLEGAARRTAMASAWCDTLTGPAMAQHSTASLHGALQQLRAQRQQVGPLPLETLGQVRAALMDAAGRHEGAQPAANGMATPTHTAGLGAGGGAAGAGTGSAAVAAAGSTAGAGAGNANTPTATATRNLLAPLLALSAAAPMSARREGRAAFVNTLLSERAADIHGAVTGGA